jgi:hypothetical protein
MNPTAALIVLLILVFYTIAYRILSKLGKFPWNPVRRAADDLQERSLR